VVDQKRSGLRVRFAAAAEIAPEHSPRATLNAQLTEIGLQGCTVETPAPFDVGTPVVLKIFSDSQYFETKATVVSVKSAAGMELTFRDTKPQFAGVLQRWLLAGMRNPEKT
jgi:PilZ domain